MTKEVLNAKLDAKISIFSEKVSNLTTLFSEVLMDRKEIMEIISTMEKSNWISDKDRINAIKMKLNEIKDNNG